MKQLQIAIYNKVISSPVNTFGTAIGSRFYFSVAPQNTSFPFATYDFVTDIYENQFKEDYEIVSVQFSLFSQSTSSSQAGDLYADLIALFDWCSLAVTGYTVVEVRRVFTNIDYFADDTVWMYTVEYRVWLRKNDSEPEYLLDSDGDFILDEYGHKILGQ
jgi:hypothetical protein